MTAQVAADLRAAAEVLRRDGWTQGQYHCGTTHCAEGAIAVVVGQHAQLADFAEVNPDLVLTSSPGWLSLQDVRAWDRRNAAENALYRQLRLTGECDDDGIPEWNDTPGRTADEVIAALEAAADTAEADQ